MELASTSMLWSSCPGDDELLSIEGIYQKASWKREGGMSLLKVLTIPFSPLEVQASGMWGDLVQVPGCSTNLLPISLCLREPLPLVKAHVGPQ